MQTKQTNFSIEKIAADTKDWLIKGELNTAMLANNFIFTSPFWQKATKEQFIKQFADPTAYIETTLAKIVKFDPVMVLFDEGHQHFAIMLTYHTKNGCSVDEVVVGTVKNGLLTKLLSIYDLAETKEALELN